MQNLKKSWVVVWKIAWGIWQIFTRALKSPKIGTLMGSFYPNKKTNELKTDRGVMRYDNEERCKTWRVIDLSFQNWHKELDKFWPQHSKISKICTLMISFWPNYMMCKAKRIWGSYAWKLWRLMQNLKENWLVFSKMTWGIWQIFTSWMENSDFNEMAKLNQYEN